MDTRREITFAISKVGASHLPKNVPCQDYSIKYEDENLLLIIVCDGHGSKTYVRSDVGSRLAVEICQKAIIEFVKDTPNVFFLDQKGAVTARPLCDDSLWGTAPNKPIEQMTDSERMNFEQAKQFYEQVKDIRKKDYIFISLFSKIISKWTEAIRKDADDNPFSETEKEALGNNRIEKAYGSTLMAYVQTPYYWFAFHIGDGRLIMADRHLEMVQPVPWDCNCFQNFTTSLCNSNPVNYFRYAFEGTGSFPAAVFCCSDGIEDSYGDYEIDPNRLHNFYKGLLDQFAKVGVETTLQKINDFLPILSEKGSRDDMSLAGIINLDKIEDGLNELEIKSQIAELTNQLDGLKQQEEKIKLRIDNATIEDHNLWKSRIESWVAKPTNQSDELKQQEEKIKPRIDKASTDENNLGKSRIGSLIAKLTNQLDGLKQQEGEFKPGIDNASTEENNLGESKIESCNDNGSISSNETSDENDMN